MGDEQMSRVKITLVGSFNGTPEGQRRTLVALGLKKRHSSVVHVVSEGLTGQIAKVRHLVSVESVAGE